MTQTSPLNIVLGRGMVFFDAFLPGTRVGEGERYIGNTTAFSIRRDIQLIERTRSARGLIIKRDDLPTRELLRGGFTTDEITAENASIWFGNNDVQLGQEPMGEQTETFVVRLGRYYQLGKMYSPIGVRNVDFVTFSAGATVIDQVANVLLDKNEGRFQVREDAADLDDYTEIQVTYQWRSSPATASFTNAVQTIEGSLRFVATNPVGPKKSYFFPRVTLSSNGEASLKGDEWQQLNFEFESVPLNNRTQQMYVVEAAGGVFTEDELAIIEIGGVTLDEFPYWEDQLNEVINVIMPSRGY